MNGWASIASQSVTCIDVGLGLGSLRKSSSVDNEPCLFFHSTRESSQQDEKSEFFLLSLGLGFPLQVSVISGADPNKKKNRHRRGKTKTNIPSNFSCKYKSSNRHKSPDISTEKCIRWMIKTFQALTKKKEPKPKAKTKRQIKHSLRPRGRPSSADISDLCVQHVFAYLFHPKSRGGGSSRVADERTAHCASEMHLFICVPT